MAGGVESAVVWPFLGDTDEAIAACGSRAHLGGNGGFRTSHAVLGGDRKRVARIREVLQGALADSGKESLPDWLEATWLRLGAADAYQAQDLRHARAFFQALGDRVATGEWRGTQDLELLLENLFAQPETSVDQTPPVQIMTIHRAKGLEFDHVLLPALDRDRGRDREPLLRWLDLPRAAGESDLVMAPAPVIGEEAGGRVGEYLKELMYRASGQ